MTPGPRPRPAPTVTAIAMALLLAAQAQAQTSDPPKPDSGLERAQKAADSVFHWIKLNADKGANRAAPAAVAAAAVEPPPAPVEEDIPLRLLSRVSPNVPRQLLAQNFRGGFAQVQFVVQPDGKVSQAQVIKASHARLGNAAIEAVQQWRFAPIPKAREAAVEVSFKADE